MSSMVCQSSVRMAKTVGSSFKDGLDKFDTHTVILLSLATSKRCESLTMLTIKPGYCEISESYIKFQPDGLEKHSRPGLVSTP